jgi:hypothetical protein
MADSVLPATLTIAGLDGAVPRLAIGSVNLTDERLDAGFAVLDAFAARGGRLIDTAEGYAGGASERLIGRWLAARPVQAREMLVLTKGAQPDAAWHSRVTPEAIAADIATSLGRLGLDRVDLWLMHRDDEAVPSARSSMRSTGWCGPGRPWRSASRTGGCPGSGRRLRGRRSMDGHRLRSAAATWASRRPARSRGRDA